MIAFISGHLNLTPERFELWYVPAILRAIDAGHSFVVGDAPGADTMAQRFLYEHGVTDVKVYFWGAWPTPRNNVGNFAVNAVGGYNNTAKDAAMTRDSDYDIAFSFRKGSGTQKNLYRRQHG